MRAYIILGRGANSEDIQGFITKIHMEMYDVSEKVKRPDKQAVKAVVDKATKISDSLTSISVNDEAVKQAVIQQAYALIDDSALREMANISIDALNAEKQGIRVSALRNAGIENMYEVYHLPVQALVGIKGIGEETAHKIKKTTNEMYDAISASRRVRIDLRQRTQYQDKLMQSLYILRNGENLRNKARELLAQEKNISTALEDVKPSSGFFGWTFSSKSKRISSVEAYRYLSDLMGGPFKDEAESCIAEYDNIVNARSNQVYADYEENAVAYYTILENLGLGVDKNLAGGLPAELVEEVEHRSLDLTHMKTSLRRYQIFGAKYILRQEKVLLGDEMGLGKTIQALAVIAHLKSKGETHFLVVCPASILVNWQRETRKHTDIPSIIIHGMDKEFEFEQWKAKGGIGIINYESLVRLADKLDFNVGIIVVDEAHLVKNPLAQRTRALIACSERTDRILYMTGTPLENRVEEMCFLIKCLRHDIAKKLSTMKSLASTQRFRNEIAPVYLRRVRDDVLDELPDLIENEDWLELDNLELDSYYVAVTSKSFMAMRRLSWDVDVSYSSKARRLLELCEQARDEGRKVIVYSFFLNTLQKVCQILGDRVIGPITGGVSPVNRQQIIDEFAKAESGTVLVAQVQTGGFGLNIQSASMVILCEPQIKPSLETQAISRAYRMGQVRDVQVHRLLCVSTVDERIMELLREKQVEFDIYADKSVAGTESLKEEPSIAWIREIIEEEEERMRAFESESAREDDAALS